MYQLLKANKPKLTDNFNIELELASESQKKDFKERIETNLIEYLHKNLNNYSISLKIIINDKDEKDNIIYSSADKFKYLSEKNKALKILAKTLDLNFE